MLDVTRKALEIAFVKILERVGSCVLERYRYNPRQKQAEMNIL